MTIDTSVGDFIGEASAGADVKALVERAKRWARDTGYDGGPESVPMQMIAALNAQAEQIDRLRAAFVRYFNEAADAQDALNEVATVAALKVVEPEPRP